MATDNAYFWPFRITSYAPSRRQFRLDESLTPEQITKAVGFAPHERVDPDKVTMEWRFWAELTYRKPDGTFGSTSTCCKIWDYQGERWSAYGWPEAFEQIGLTPLFQKDYGTWTYKEDGNPTLSFLARGLSAQAMEAGTAETTGSVHDSAVGNADAPNEGTTLQEEQS